VIDAVNRLRQFMQALQGSSRHPDLSRFREETQGVTDLRNTVQHLHKRPVFGPLTHEAHPLLGTLSWVHAPDLTSPERTIVVALPGALRETKTAPGLGVTLAWTATRTIDHLTLSAWEPSHGAASKTAGTAPHTPTHERVIAVSLTETVARVVTVARVLEDLLRPQFEGEPTSGGDLVLAIVLTAGEGAVHVDSDT